MNSLEHARAELYQAFPQGKAPAAEYRALALAEAHAARIQDVTAYIPGNVRSLDWVCDVLWRTPTVAAADKPVYFRAMQARQRLLHERLKAGEVHISSLMAVTALKEAGRYAHQQSELLRRWADEGYDISFIPQLPPGALGPDTDSTIITTGSPNPEHTGVYMTLDKEINGSHERWLPGQELVIAHQRIHASLRAQAIPFADGLQQAQKLAANS